MNTNKEWLKLNDAAQCCKFYSKRQIQKLAEPGIQRIRTKKEKGHLLYNKLDILQYAASHPRNTILNTVWDEIDHIEGECFYPLFGYDNKYFISNKLRVINATTGQVLTPTSHKNIKGNETGYRQVTLRKGGKGKTETLHRLVGETQCENVLRKNIYHHIKIEFPSNDHANNLLPVWDYQHIELHNLLNAGKKKEYKDMVKAIKKENSQKLYKIPHPDYKPDGNYNYYLFVTEEGNKAYNRGEEIPPNSIIKESAELAERGETD